MTDPPRVEVALPLPVFHTFTYRLEGRIPPVGTRVLVPFRRGERVGWVVGPGREETPQRIRPVLAVLDSEPVLPPDLFALAHWMARYYGSPLGMVLRSLLPAPLSDASRDVLTLVGPMPEDATPREKRVVEALRDAAGPRRVRALARELGVGTIWPEIRRLEAQGVLRHETLPPRDPPVRTRKVVRLLRWLPDLAAREQLFRRSPRQRDAVAFLEGTGGSAELAHLLERGGFSRSVIAGLEAKGIVSVFEEPFSRDPFRHLPPPAAPDLHPTADQARAIDTLLAEAASSKPRPVLLHGVTGSGKTLVYLEVLKKVVEEEGKGAIVLVPEISLTPQTVSRFRARFGDQVAVLHSALSEGERLDGWRDLRSGRKRVVVGARSAIFAPIRDLGVLVVDEEHDGSYKQSEGARYHARDVAVMRAAQRGALCILGSATPSLESWQNARSGKFRLLSLPERVAGGTLPPVRVVDLRELRKRARDGGAERRSEGVGGVISPELARAIEDRVERREQVILLLNRRGYANFVQCLDCGEVRRCPHCSVSLTYHRLTQRLLCHHCRYEEVPAPKCARCGSPDLSYRGLGTEQVERLVVERFPRARVARMDVDTTSGRWSHHEILGRVERGEVDILLGTQMIAKGLDFPRVTLVGVVNADIGLHLPDFRSAERTFQLLSQVAGRTGRGPLGGEVIVQTSLPGHYAVRAALKHDYQAFAEKEVEERKEPGYPPWVRLANVLLSGPVQGEVAAEADRAAGWFRRASRGLSPPVTVVGPAPAPIERIRNRWRWHFLLKSSSSRSLGALLLGFVERFRPRGREVRVALDRDPVALL